ncbi:TULIP family P47-like protein [Bacillus thuringiensis]|nr:TULIP family P47-like protein [Bacillus thuringiensis]
MKNRQLDSLKIYDWVQTSKDEKNRNIMFSKKLSTNFYQEIKESTVHGEVTGNWGEWVLTDEGSGQYPIFKCYIENGIFELNINNKKTTYNLENTWIKIGLKIEESQNEEYVVSEKEGSLYGINHDFHLSKENNIASTLVERLFITWFKENRNVLQKQINAYTIYHRTSKDLSLIGWDTSYVTSFSNVNKTIQQQKLFPSTFEKEFVDEEFGIKLRTEGTFDSWEITTGSDGQNVNFICKFGENCSVTNENTGKKYEFAPTSYIKIQCKLNYFNSQDKTVEDPTGLGDGYQFELKVKDTNENGDPAIIIITKFISEEISNSTILDPLVEAMFKEWFNENIDQFETIFSYFLLEETAMDENFQWLKPTTAYYGVAEAVDEEENPSMDKSVFAVMSMVENHINESPSHTVDARLLQAVKNEQDSNDSAFGIDMPLFVEKWIKQALITMQIGTLDQFETTDNGLMIKNKEKIKFGTFPNASDEDVPAYVDTGKFSLGIVNNQLVLEIVDLNWEQASGLRGHVNFKQFYDLKLKSGIDELGKEYKNVLIPTETNEATMLITYTIEEWKERENLIIEIVTGIALGILTGYAGGKLFEKAAKYIKAAFKKSGNNMSAEIQLRPMGNSIGAEMSEEASEEVIFSITDDLSDGFTVANINTIANTSRPMFKKILMISPKVLGGILVGAVGSVIPTAVIKAIENANKEYYSELPTINEFVANSVGTVQWPDSSEFQLETANLRGIYLLGGQLNKEQ